MDCQPLRQGRSVHATAKSRFNPLSIPVLLRRPLLGMGLVGAWLCATPANAAPPNCVVPNDYPTIQAAVNDVNCTTVVLQQSLYTENVTISRSVTVYGISRGNTTVQSAADGKSVFTVQNPNSSTTALVTLHGMTIKGGHASLGGGINNVGATLLLDDVLVTQNRADSGGGGIYNAGGGKLSLATSTVAGNSAGLGGGGIYNSAALSSQLFDHVPSEGELQKEAFEFIQTFPDLFSAGDDFVSQFQVVPLDPFKAVKQEIDRKLDTSSLHDFAGSPAAVFSNFAIFTVTFVGNSQVTGNVVDGTFTDGGHTIPLGFGGGIYNELALTVITDNSSIDNNSVTATGISAGGGIFTFGLTGIYKSTITKNSAIPSSEVKGPAFGGGIVNMLGRLDIGAPTASTEQVLITNNTVSSTFMGLGGGIESIFGSNHIYFAHIDGNTIPTSGNGGFVRGAGISNDGLPILPGVLYSPTVELTDSTVNNNSVGTTLGVAKGGGIQNNIILNLTRTTVSGNAANSTVGNAGGGGIWSGHGNVAISQSTVSGNSANSGLLAPNPNYAQGGGIYTEGTILSVAQSTVSDNNAVSQGVPALSNYAQGGGIYYRPATQSEIESGEISTSVPTLTIDASTIVNNSVSSNCTGCGVGNNTVLQAGGVYADPETVTVQPPGQPPVQQSITTVNIYGSVLALNASGSCNAAPTVFQTNFTDDPACGTASSVNPQLLGLGDFGGPTQTYVPLPSSPLRATGFPAGNPHCFAQDQRGTPHTGNGPCDIGSVQGPPFLVNALNGQGAGAGTIGTSGAITATLSQDLDPTTAVAANVVVLSKFQGKLNVNVTYSSGSHTLTIQPNSPLIVGDTLTTLLTSGFKATDGQHLLPYQKQTTVQGAPFCVSNVFDPVTTNLPNVSYGSIEWADYDGDGKLDAVITGVVSFTFDANFPYGPINTYVTDIYHNDGNGQFTPIHAGLTPVGYGNAVWGDYDGDGKPDLLVMGRRQPRLLETDPSSPNVSVTASASTGSATIYHNNGDGTFTKFQEFPGFETGQAAWVDINNDGKLDAVFLGITFGDTSHLPIGAPLDRNSKIYRNDGNTFTDIGDILPQFTNGAVGITDYDSDGRMDISISGTVSTLFHGQFSNAYFNNPSTNIFHNVSNAQIRALYDVNSGPLPELRFSSMDWADVDGDGKPDLLISGEAALSGDGVPPIPFAGVFKNNGDGSFTDLHVALPAVSYGQARFGDYDNDGHPDILLTGLTNGGFNQGTTVIFHNDGTGVFTQVATPPPGVSYSYVSWADINGDGKLEFSVVGTPKSGGSVLTQVFTPANCRGADVSFTTPKNAVLTVAAPGLLADANSQQAATGVSVVAQPANGTLTAFPGDGSFVYTPNLNFFGTDTFAYSIQNSTGSSTAPATVTITVLSQAVACWATPNGGTTVYQGIDGSVVQQAIDVASTGATVRVAGICSGVQSRGGQSQTAYISKNLTLEGGYAAQNWSTSNPTTNPTILDAAGAGHVVNVIAGNTAILYNLTVSGGSASNGGGVLNAGTTTLSNVSVVNNGAGNGGGIANSSVLSLDTVNLSSNSATYGGGVWNSGATASATIVNSMIAGNSANGTGGAIFNAQSAILNLSASTLTANHSGGNGAAINNETGASAAILNSTFVSNSASGFGGATSTTGGATTTVRNSTINANFAQRGGGFFVQGGSASFVNTINVKNSNGNCSGPMTSQGHNVDTDTTCNFHVTGDLAVDPQLQPLASNGGPTPSELLSFKSPAIDKGDPAQCPSTDQRGLPRPDGTACDIGAIEQSVPGVAATNDSYAAGAGVQLNVSAGSGVLANDFSKNNSVLTAQLGTTTVNGILTLNSDGSFMYLAGSGFTGTDSFTYTAKNGLGTSAPATVTISVTAFQSCSATVDGATVFTSTDSGALQSAINAAGYNSTVKVAGTCAGVLGFDVLQDFSAASSTIYINRNVTVQGGYVAGQWTDAPDPIAHPTILDAQNHGRVVTIESRYTMPTANGQYSVPIATNVTLSGLTMQNGNAGANQFGYAHGGGIAVLGATVTVQNSVIQNNTTAGNGGGLYFATSVDDRNTLIQRNVAIGGFYFHVYDVNNYNAAKSGLLDGDFTKQESIDGGPFVQLSGTLTEPYSANPGLYMLDLTAAELNGNVIILRFTAPGAMPMDIVLRTSANLASANPYTLTVTNSSFKNNTASGQDAASEAQGGGGIYVLSKVGGGPAVTAPATANVSTTTSAGNQTPFSGGGLMSEGATVTFTQGTISGNTAHDGGGFGGSGTLTMQNSTVSGNHATASGGGASYGGSAVVSNSTVAFNTAQQFFGGLTGGIQIKNSIVAKNDIGDCNGIASAGGNIDSDGSCRSQGSDKTAADPGLVALANNGGATQTHALSAVSGAINAGVNCLTTDQRGQARLAAPAICDAGSFELTASLGAQDDAYRAQKNVALNIAVGSGVLANDVGTGVGVVSATKVTNPAHGTLTLNANGSFTYTPVTNFTGPDSFTYVATQGSLTSNVATVRITVVPLLTCAATANNGTTVFSTVQQAIDAAPSGGTVKVAGICAGTPSQVTLGIATYNQAAFINKPLTLQGGFNGTNWTAAADPIANQTVVDASHTGGVVLVVGTSVNMPVTMQNLIMTNATDRPVLTLLGANVTISNFEISNGVTAHDDGAGVHCESYFINNGGTFTGLPMNLTLTNGSILNNQTSASGMLAGFGGGISLTNTSANLTNVTIAGNSATLRGGGIIVNSGGMSLSNSTISGNKVLSVTGTGGAIYGGANVSNTIISGNTSASGNCTGALNSLGYNLDSDGTCRLGGVADISLVDASLAPVTNNGGFSSTAALLSNSRAINAGDCSGGTVPIDQRGITRPQGAACDIGAYELAAGGDVSGVPVSPGGTVTTDPVGVGATPTAPLQVAVTSPNAGDVTIQVATNNTAPAGLTTIGWQATITVPTASAQTPLRIAFSLDSSIVPAGSNQNTIQVFKNGTVVPACSPNNGTATPDPCVSTRAVFSSGDLELDVFSSTSNNSIWTFNVPITAPVLSLPANAASNEGSAFVQTGSFTDAASTTWTATVDYGDGLGVQALPLTGKTFTLSHIYATVGTYIAKVSVTGVGGTSNMNVSVLVANVAPIVSAGTNATIATGAFTRNGSFVDPGTETWAGSVNYGDGTNFALPLNTDKTFTLNHSYGKPGTYTVSVSVTDSLGGSGTASFNVTITNAAPVVTPSATQSIAQGSSAVLQLATFVDGGALESHTASINWGDTVSTNGFVTDNGTSGVISGSHAFTATGNYTVTITVTDDLGLSGTASLTVIVTDSAPSLLMPVRLTVDEGSVLTSSGSFVDVGTNKTWTATIDYGDSTGSSPLTLNADKSFVLSHVYTHSGSFLASVTVKDSNGGQTTATSVVAVNDIAPSLLLGPGGSIHLGDTFSALGSFSDPGAQMWTATVDFGDGSGSQLLALNSDKTFALSHQYATSGSFTITVIVTDSGGASGTKTIVETVTGTAPTIAITDPTNNSTISGLVTVTATVTGDATITGVKFAIDGAQIGSILTSMPYATVLDARTLSAGTHVVSATVTSSAGTSMTSISVLVDNNPGPGDAIVDSNTAFSVQGTGENNIGLCGLCSFASIADILPGQTIEVRRRPGSTPPVAQEVILKQGSISGTISSANGTSFTMQSNDTLLKNVTVQVLTDVTTVLQGFSNAGFAAVQKVVVRGFLYKGSSPGTAVLIAKQVELVP